jgi:hypothetical protein
MPTDPVVFAFDVTPDRAWSSIAVAGRRSDGLAHVEVVEHRPGTSWVPDRVAELVATHTPLAVVADPSGPAGGLFADVTRAGVEVMPVNTRQHTQACGALYDAVTQQRVRHIGQPMLSAALDGAARRILADAWLWGRSSSSCDISPLVAVTLAFGTFLVPVEDTASTYEGRGLVTL